MSVVARHSGALPAAPTGSPARAALERGPDGETLFVHLAGEWRLGGERPDVRALEVELEERPARQIVLTADELGAWDTSLLTWLYAARGIAGARGVATDFSRLPGGIATLLRLAEGAVEQERRERPSEVPFLARIGAWALNARKSVRSALGYLGRLTLALGRFLTFRAQFRPADIQHLMQTAGAEALPIITLVSLIVGMILAFVGAVQLRLFGADLYVADLVAIAIVREMGAMVVGIVMAGRTGAAFAAQLATMKVNEEIDALRTFGISIIDFLVLPRVVALFLMVPLLCLYAIVIGIAGGALVGVGLFGLSPQLYLDQSLQAVTLADMYGGLFRSLVYGLLIGLIGCLRGMESGNDASAVGEATTSAVVTAIVAIVVADGVMAVVFDALGI